MVHNRHLCAHHIFFAFFWEKIHVKVTKSTWTFQNGLRAEPLVDWRICTPLPSQWTQCEFYDFSLQKKNWVSAHSSHPYVNLPHFWWPACLKLYNSNRFGWSWIKFRAYLYSQSQRGIEIGEYVMQAKLKRMAAHVKQNKTKRNVCIRKRRKYRFLFVVTDF